MRAKELLDEIKHVDVNSELVSRQTRRIPTDAFLVAALASIGLSLGLKLTGHDRNAQFVGQWAPTLVGLGLLRKLMDHDPNSHS